MKVDLAFNAVKIVEFRALMGFCELPRERGIYLFGLGLASREQKGSLALGNSFICWVLGLSLIEMEKPDNMCGLSKPNSVFLCILSVTLISNKKTIFSKLWRNLTYLY